jgi:hypothetical protein
VADPDVTLAHSHSLSVSLSLSLSLSHTRIHCISREAPAVAPWVQDGNNGHLLDQLVEAQAILDHHVQLEQAAAQGLEEIRVIVSVVVVMIRTC